MSLVVWAQQVPARAPDELPRVILGSAGDEADPAIRTFVVAFEQGLRAVGWSAGVNMRLDYRWLGKRAAAAAAETAGLRPPLLDVYCEKCLHHAPMALVPLIIRWGPDASSDQLRSLPVALSAAIGARRCSIPDGRARI